MPRAERAGCSCANRFVGLWWPLSPRNSTCNGAAEADKAKMAASRVAASVERVNFMLLCSGTSRGDCGWEFMGCSDRLPVNAAFGDCGAGRGHHPLRGSDELRAGHVPKVARASQPWVEGAIPLGIWDGRER